jgi:hypothetical protein
MDRQRVRFGWALAALVVARSGVALALPSAEVSLNNCQNAVKVATATFVKNKAAAIDTCLQAVSTQMVKNNAADAGGAASTCVTQFRKLSDPTHPGKSLSDQLAAAITGKCDPTLPGATHTLADILGAGAGVSQPLNAENLNAWCSHFGGSGSIGSLQDWIDCISAAAECDVDSAIAAQYPRVLDWLNLVKPSMQALTPPAGDPNRIADAVAGLDAMKAAIDGPDNDNVISLQCGGVVSTGTAVASNCLVGTTFSNGTAGGVAGTMPNNGAVVLTPGTSNQTIAAGYHNGAGYCAGDANLVSGNIRSGATIFGVSGNPNVINTSGATVTAADMVSGKTAYASGGLVTGTVPAGANVNGPNGSKTFTIPDALYSGSETATANDTNLVAGNIINGVSIFGVTGSAGILPAQPLRTGQTQCDQGNSTMGACPGSPTGQDGALLKGATRNYTDNGDGTITDNKTGLMWEKLSSDGSIHDSGNGYTWYTAFTAKIAPLNSSGFAGHTDWRLPNRFELETLPDLGRFNPSIDPVFNTNCVSGCSVMTCSCTQSFNYWTSTTPMGNTGDAWSVEFYGGIVGGYSKGNSYKVRAVRGGANPSQLVKTGQTTSYGTGSDGAVETGMRRSFTDNGDGTITDNATGLMWEKKDQSGGIHDYSNTYTWSGASYGGTNIIDGTITTTFLATLNAGGGFAGHTDWRIPNRFELESIANLQNAFPAVDAAFNTGCAASCTVLTCSCTQSIYYWSSTTYQNSPVNAWGVYFGIGSVNTYGKSNSYYARAVRGGS